MKRIATTLSLIACSGAASAGGIDRSGQNIGVLFETGRYAEFALGYSRPDISGTDMPLGDYQGGNFSGDVADNFTQVGLAFKADINEKLSYAVIFDQPFGADVDYGTGSANLATPFGGTTAEAKAYALTTLLRYKFDERFSVHGGLRAQKADGHIALRGNAYSAFGNYDVELSPDWGLGYVVGAAYEIPEIALRVALTYQSEIEHDFDTFETGVPAIGPDGLEFLAVRDGTDVKTPRSLNLDFQSGIMADTLLFGQVRWVKWSEFKVNPTGFAAAEAGFGLPPEGLIALDNTITYTLGIGRKFNETWSGAASVSYERKDEHKVSPLAPTNGRIGMTLAAIYTQDNMKITTGVNYTALGRSEPETGTPDQARADFRDNDAVSVGVKVSFSF